MGKLKNLCKLKIVIEVKLKDNPYFVTLAQKLCNSEIATFQERQKTLSFSIDRLGYLSKQLKFFV